MHDQPIGGVDAPDRCSEEQQTDCIVIGLLLLEGGWPWSVEEVARELGSEQRAMESVRRLTERGLAHLLEGFVFPSRAARRAAEMEIGTC